MAMHLKPYPAMKPSGSEWLGDVPKHWALRPLKAVLSKNDSGVWGGDPDEGDGSATVVLRSTEQTVDGGWATSSPARRLLSEREKASALLEVGDLVVTKSSGSELHIGKTSLVTANIAELGACFSNFMQRLRCRRGFEPRLVWYLLNSPIGRQQLVFNSNTTTGLANLNGTILGDVITPVPPIAEQAAIVRYLDYVDRRISRYIRAKQRLIELLEEEKQVIINRAVTRGLDPNVPLKPSGVEWLGDVPEHWEAVPLKRISSLDNSGSYGSEPEQGEQVLPVATTAQIDSAGNFSVERMPLRGFSTSEAQRYVCRAGDILIVKSSGSIFNVISGKAGIIRPETPEFSFSNFLLRIVADPSRVEPEYLFLVLNGHLTKERVKRMVSGSTYPNLKVADYVAARVPVPPLSEQRAIVSAASPETAMVDRAAKAAENEIALLGEYRTRLIADVVTGKLDVREAAAGLPEADPADLEDIIEIHGAAAPEFAPELEEVAT